MAGEYSTNFLLAQCFIELQKVVSCLKTLQTCFIPLAFKEGDAAWYRGVRCVWQDGHWKPCEEKQELPSPQ